MKRLLPVTAATCLVFFASGCGPSLPKESEARAWFESEAAQITSYDDRVRRYVADEGLLAIVPEEDARALELGAARERARATFRERRFPQIARQLGALGAHLRLLDGPTDTGTLASAGTPEPVRNSGNVAAGDGVEVDGRKLGWGVYGLDAEDGGVRDVRGYEVYWEAAVEGRMVGFQLYMSGR